LAVSRLALSDYRFYAGYQTDRTLCTYRAGLGVYLPYEFPILINLVRGEGDTYRGSFAIDKFQPGICGWKFTGISYVSPQGGGRNSLGVFTERQGIAPAAAPHVDMWCYKVTKDQSKLADPKCEVLASLRWPNADRRVNPEFLSTFSQEQQSDNGTVGITTNTKELSVELHDLKSTPGALIPLGDYVEQNKAGEEARAAYAASPEAKVEPCFQNALGAYIRAHPESATQPAGAASIEIRNKCRADFGLAPLTPKY
jgi:hypothetical protein